MFETDPLGGSCGMGCMSSLLFALGAEGMCFKLFIVILVFVSTSLCERKRQYMATGDADGLAVRDSFLKYIFGYGSGL